MRKAIVSMLAVAALGLVQVQAEVIAHYGFSNVATSVDTQLNTTAGEFVIGPGIGAFSYSGLGAESTSNSIYCWNNSFYSASRTAAIAASDYFTFSIDVDSGYGANLDSLSFYTQRDETSGAHAPDSYSIFTSQDGFADSVGTDIGGIITSTNNSFTQHTLDLSGVGNLQLVTGSIEIRIYMWTTTGIGDSGEREFRMDEVRLEGTVEDGVAPPLKTLADYEFEDVATSSDTEVGTTASSFTNGPGCGSFDYSGLGQEGKSTYFYNDLFHSADETAAVAANDYLYFTVSVDPDFEVGVSNLTFYTHRFPVLGAGAPDHFSIYTSQDSYGSSVGSGLIPAAASDSDNTFTAHTLDLSSISNLQSVTGVLEVRIYLWPAQGLGLSTERTFRVDEVSLNGAIKSTLSGSAAFEAWIATFSVGTETNQTDNPDGDALNNLYEWGLGGKPDDGANIGHLSTFGVVEDGGTDYLKYVYAKRNNADALGLSYYLEQNTDLIAGVWTNDNYEVVDTGSLNGEFDSVTNRAPMDVEAQQFLRLTIEVAD